MSVIAASSGHVPIVVARVRESAHGRRERAPRDPRGRRRAARIQAAVWAGVHGGDLPEDLLEAVGSDRGRGAVADGDRRAAVAAAPGADSAGRRPGGRLRRAGPGRRPGHHLSLDGELLALCVDPAAGAGHGRRLVNAVADLRRRTASGHLHAWLATAESDLRAFLAGAGWAADGATAAWTCAATATVLVDQARLRTALVDL